MKAEHWQCLLVWRFLVNMGVLYHRQEGITDEIKISEEVGVTVRAAGHWNRCELKRSVNGWRITLKVFDHCDVAIRYCEGDNGQEWNERSVRVWSHCRSRGLAWRRYICGSGSYISSTRGHSGGENPLWKSEAVVEVRGHCENGGSVSSM